MKTPSSPSPVTVEKEADKHFEERVAKDVLKSIGIAFGCDVTSNYSVRLILAAFLKVRLALGEKDAVSATTVPGPETIGGVMFAAQEALIALGVLAISDKDCPIREISPTLRAAIYRAHDLLLAALTLARDAPSSLKATESADVVGASFAIERLRNEVAISESGSSPFADDIVIVCNLLERFLSEHGGQPESASGVSSPTPSAPASVEHVEQEKWELVYEGDSIGVSVFAHGHPILSHGPHHVKKRIVELHNASIERAVKQQMEQ